MTFYNQAAKMILEKGGFGDLTDEQKKEFEPQIAVLVQDRVGIELLPKLDKEQAKEFAELSNVENTTPEQWSTFWNEAVPNFEDEIARIVGDVFNLASNVNQR
jgi:hypothetical protein